MDVFCEGATLPFNGAQRVGSSEKMAMKVPVWWLPLAFFLWSLAICLTSCSIAYTTGSCPPLPTHARTQ